MRSPSSGGPLKSFSNSLGRRTASTSWHDTSDGNHFCLFRRFCGLVTFAPLSTSPTLHDRASSRRLNPRPCRSRMISVICTIPVPALAMCLSPHREGTTLPRASDSPRSTYHFRQPRRIPALTLPRRVRFARESAAMDTAQIDQCPLPMLAMR